MQGQGSRRGESDGPALRGDGTVRLGDAVLRRPRLGELRDLRATVPRADATDDERAGWVADAVAALAGRSPDPDDLPAWVAEPAAPADLVHHWRSVPAGPWRPLATGGARAEGPLAGTWFGEFAPLYEAFAARGIGAREADLYEVWEVAAALGVLDAKDDDRPERDYIAERVAAHRRGAPPPTPGPPGRGFATLLGRAPGPDAARR